MQKVIQKFSSFKEAEKAEIEFWKNYPKAKKLAVLEEIRQRGYPDEFPKRLQRVCRIIKLEES
jgi:predicted Fe-S protein YdhL (DUF1289 family)